MSLQSELTALRAVLLTIGQLQTNRSKGELLVDILKKKPELGRYFHAVYVPDSPHYHAIDRETKGRAVELSFDTPTCEVVGKILHNDLDCGLTAAVVSKAFQLSGWAPLTDGPAPANLTLSFIDSDPQTAVAVLSANGTRVANMSWIVGPGMRAAVAALRAAGVAVIAEKHAEI